MLRGLAWPRQSRTHGRGLELKVADWTQLPEQGFVGMIQTWVRRWITLRPGEPQSSLSTSEYLVDITTWLLVLNEGFLEGN